MIVGLQSVIIHIVAARGNPLSDSIIGCVSRVWTHFSLLFLLLETIIDFRIVQILTLLLLIMLSSEVRTSIYIRVLFSWVW